MNHLLFIYNPTSGTGKIAGELSGNAWKKISLLIGCAALLVFQVLMLFILYTSFGQVEDISRLFPWR